MPVLEKLNKLASSIFTTEASKDRKSLVEISTSNNSLLTGIHETLKVNPEEQSFKNNLMNNLDRSANQTEELLGFLREQAFTQTNIFERLLENTENLGKGDSTKAGLLGSIATKLGGLIAGLGSLLGRFGSFMGKGIVSIMTKLVIPALTTAFTVALPAIAVVLAAGVGLAVGTAINKGLGRLFGIEDEAGTKFYEGGVGGAVGKRFAKSGEEQFQEMQAKNKPIITTETLPSGDIVRVSRFPDGRIRKEFVGDSETSLSPKSPIAIAKKNKVEESRRVETEQIMKARANQPIVVNAPTSTPVSIPEKKTNIDDMGIALMNSDWM